MVRCAYCGAEGKMSRQHVIPKGFINNMNFKALTVWLDKASSKVINSELMVKDVCAECNNGELSQLDAYALKLIISYNEKILYETRKVFFKYNYDLLTRWLLKVCYNLLAGKTLTGDCIIKKPQFPVKGMLQFTRRQNPYTNMETACIITEARWEFS